MTPSGMEPTTFRFVAQCLNQLRHRVPPLVFYKTHFRSAEALILLIACMTESGKVRLGLAHVDEFRMHLTTLESCSAYQNA